MHQAFDGKTSHTVSGRFAIVVSRYNESITGKLLAGALETLTAAGVHSSQVHVPWVPGAWAIPLVAQQFAKRREYLTVICLGAVIRLSRRFTAPAAIAESDFAG